MRFQHIREALFGDAKRPSPWRPLVKLRDRTLPKLDHLRRAARAGLLVPEPTFWAYAADLEDRCDSDLLTLGERVGFPCIVRSISPTEDTPQGSRAGQFLSLVVKHARDLPGSVARVVSSLPMSGGRRRGAVAVQPFLVNPRAGVTFFDGFYFEESELRGQNGDVTSGRRRGHIHPGQVERGEPRSDWLLRIHRLLGGPLDVEWTETARGERILLQARPALFPVRRCETLSLANHRETLGDLPSPWITGVYSELGHPVLELARRADPSLPDWNEPYAIRLAGRAWVNFSSLFRLMDRWGLPRTLVCRTLGGESAGSLDHRFLPGAFLRSFPSLVRMAWICLLTDFTASRDLKRLDGTLNSAASLMDLWDANVQTHRLSVRNNFALIAVATTSAGLRRRLGLASRADAVTRAMMDEYSGLARRPRLADRLRGLDDWLRRYGHRGPRETDPAQPRFSELQGMLRQDLARVRTGPDDIRSPRPFRRYSITHLLCYWEERREWFRDVLMRHTQRLRWRILEEAGAAVEAGHLDQPDDVFFLLRNDLSADPGTWKSRVARTRARCEHERSLDLPSTGTRDAIEQALARSIETGSHPEQARFRGIGLGSEIVTGTVVRPETIDDVLRRKTWPESAILVVDALEPSWGVVYPRFGAVVSQLGGELSHAAILLREARLPGVINAAGVFHGLAEGDTVRVDPVRGEVIRLSARESEPDAAAQSRGSGTNPSAIPACS
jgi:phosphohistidine swiveling domain-containing protein